MSEYIGKMEFFYQGSANGPKVVVTLSPHTDLGEALEQFEGFLKAAGYQFDGDTIVFTGKEDAKIGL